MPGVSVLTSTRSGASNPTVPISARWFIVGQTERGSTTAPQRVRNLPELESLYGARVTYGNVYDAARLFFQEGGGELIVQRVVGTTPVVSTIVLVDRAGSPLNTIRVNALNPGAWANGWTVTVAAGTSSGVKITLKDGTGATIESWDNVADPASIAALRSAYVQFVNLNSATSAPNNLPAVATSTLASGTDDRGTIVGQHYVTALSLFTKTWGAGAVSVPGLAATTAASASTIGAGILAHCQQFNRIGILNTAAGVAYTQAITDAATFRSASADSIGIAWPWVSFPDGVATRTVSPDAYVAAVRARAHELYFPNQVPAGELAIAKTITALETDVSDANGDLADSGGVSVIRNIQGTIRLYGYRSLSTDTDNYFDLARRDALDVLAYEGQRRLEKYMFATIDSKGQLLKRIEAELNGMVAGIAAKGGFWGLTRWDGRANVDVDPGYRAVVQVDGINPNKLKAFLYVRFAPNAQLIELNLVSAGLTASIV